ncbi:SCO0930 family lipoprotein [Streptomyces sp. NPDC058892]|uniref:SCO0930 family lipoprotein n=1 Tax=unclassified Streptomyces TaxID=2593676 RepID=UPI00044D24DB|nr:SCO0930 family lipoprotein [Streptomyces sp. PCS3-D2]WKV75110.1 SCO0930 family lipoprotein [Streptomyces sp. PCS3-D2]
MGMKRATTFAAAAAAVVLAASACGPSDYSASDSTQPAGAAEAAPAAAGPGNQPGGQLAASVTEQLGSVLTDSAGLTLYRFDKDTAKPPKSNCEGDCAKTWPVVAAGDVTAASGMDPSLLGEVVRSDGTKQLTVAGWPAYRFNKDAKPGDINGQGVGGVWFAFGPDGKKAAKSAPAEAAPDAPAEGAPAEAGEPTPGLSVAKDPKLGEHIVDGKGMTVYRFKKDTAWPMVSNCVGDCLAKWPVVPPVDKANAKGIIEKNYRVMDRPDGKKQQTVDCWPVYTFSGDKKPGDTNGQGVGGTWYAVSPDGKLITVQ